MSRYPAATWKPIAPGANDPRITVIGAILHVDAGNSEDLFNYFNGPSGGIESHFHIPKARRPFQYRDTGWEADANHKANSFIKNGKRYGYVSIETQGYGSGGWNAHQLDEIKALLLWLSKTHNFPLRVCRNPTDPGVGYHTLFGAPSAWTPVAKSCPGPDRIKQFNNIIVPWMRDGAEGEVDMAVSKDDAQKIALATLTYTNPEVDNGGSRQVYSHILEQTRSLKRVEATLAALAKGPLPSAADIASELAPLLRDDLTDALASAGVPSSDDVARTVLDTLAARLSEED